mmetsp:Transcript_41840/g.94511  ORF Transcript_41840/g.94511 Transcript_41840/m.94511 type:complete len:208 (+) Transcript_41840:284-907(+)
MRGVIFRLGVSAVWPRNTSKWAYETPYLTSKKRAFEFESGLLILGGIYRTSSSSFTLSHPKQLEIEALLCHRVHCATLQASRGKPPRRSRGRRVCRPWPPWPWTGARHRTPPDRPNPWSTTPSLSGRRPTRFRGKPAPRPASPPPEPPTAPTPKRPSSPRAFQTPDPPQAQTQAKTRPLTRPFHRCCHRRRSGPLFAGPWELLWSEP